MSIRLDSMLERWVDLFPGASQEAVLQHFCGIQDYYREPHRRFHTLEHIERLLRLQEHYFPSASRALRIAIWLHDLVYDPLGSDNELQSAKAPRVIVGELGGGTQLADTVYRLIMVTKDHVAQTGDESKICDLDLLSLGDTPAAYAVNTALIRREYAQVPEPQWRQGRREFMRLFLERENIYQTLKLRAIYEKQARHNLIAEQQALEECS